MISIARNVERTGWLGLVRPFTRSSPPPPERRLLQRTKTPVSGYPSSPPRECGTVLCGGPRAGLSIPAGWPSCVVTYHNPFIPCHIPSASHSGDSKLMRFSAAFWCLRRGPIIRVEGWGSPASGNFGLISYQEQGAWHGVSDANGRRAASAPPRRARRREATSAATSIAKFGA